MNKADILARLKQGILEDLHLEDLTLDDIHDDMALFGSGLGLDSIDAVELVVLVEKYFAVSITSGEEAKQAFVSLDVLASFIEERLKAAAG